MPPKAKAAKRVKQDAERVSHPVVEAPLPGTKELTGFLSLLPLEILMEVLVRCEPSGVTRLLATSKALTNIANENETTIYRKLYHNLLVKNVVGAHVIHSPVWKKGKASISYPLSASLPAAVVYSWKTQYKNTALYKPRSGARSICTQGSCVQCGRTVREAVILDVATFELNLCLACYAKGLVPKSSVQIYQLTAGDVGALPLADVPTAGGFGNIKTGQFYSAFALRQLAIQKHGSFDGPVAVTEIKRLERARRVAVVDVATLLYGGSHHASDFSNQQGFDAGWFSEEFIHHIDGKKIVTKSSKQRCSYPPHPKGFVNRDQLTDRPLDDILRHYVQVIRNHKDDFPAAPDGTPQFLPARRPGPLIPSEASIAAFEKLIEGDRFYDYFFLMSDYRSVGAVRTFQHYVLNPTEDNLRLALDLLDDSQFLSRNTEKKRKIFVPLRKHRPFEYKSLLAVLDSSKPVKRMSGLQRYRRDTHKCRVKLLAQAAEITGNSFTPDDLRCSMGGVLPAGEPLWRPSTFFANGGIQLLMQTYVASIRERDEAFGHLAQEQLTADVQSSCAGFASRLSPLCNRPMRAEHFKSRAEHSFEEMVEEVRDLGKALAVGTATPTGFVAALIEADNLTTCPRRVNRAAVCLDKREKQLCDDPAKNAADFKVHFHSRPDHAAKGQSRQASQADAEIVSHPVVEAPLPGTKELTGFLSMLPLEILMEVLVRCEPSGVTRLLATSKALTNIANENETTIYRKLYHNLLVEDAFGAHVIHSPVWKKGNWLISYPLSDPLPAAAVYSWKLQYRNTARYTPDRTVGTLNMRCLRRSCVQCQRTHREAKIVGLAAFRLNLCIACYAKELTPKSSISIYRLSPGDTATLPLHDVPTTESIGGTTKNLQFYSAFALRQIAIQKHGSFDGPVGIADSKKEEHARRLAIAATASLLQGGTHHSVQLGKRKEFDVGLFTFEFEHYVQAKRFPKAAPRTTRFITPAELTNRPIDQILASYVQLIREHKDDCTEDENGIPHFLPARRPGPLIPTDASIAAMRRLVGERRENDYLSIMARRRTVGAVRTFQRYILNPTEDNYQLALDLLDDSQFRSSGPQGQYCRTTPLPPLLPAEPFDASLPLADLDRVALARPDVRDEAAERIELVMQFSKITGGWNQLWGGTVATLFGSHALNTDHWVAQFFEGLRSGYLKQIYSATRIARNEEFSKVAEREYGIFGPSDFASDPSPHRRYAGLVHQFVPTFCRPQRAQFLSHRFSIPYEQVEEGIQEFAQALSSGQIAPRGFLAALVRIKDSWECPDASPGGAPVCIDNCWIREIPYDHCDAEDSYSEGSYEYEE